MNNVDFERTCLKTDFCYIPSLRGVIGINSFTVKCVCVCVCVWWERGIGGVGGGGGATTISFIYKQYGHGIDEAAPPLSPSPFLPSHLLKTLLISA